jgi:3-dehydroquinate synthase
MARTVEVKLGERSYPIRIGTCLPPPAALELARGMRVMIVSDSTVDPLYGPACQAQVEAQGCGVVRETVPAGETSKDWEWAAHLHARAAAARLDRASTIIALGGGVVGDLAGFVAATYLRGVRLVQLPTTLLAMVDSSVGGKTGINLPQGKNLVGAFYQPVEVVADLATLGTLPEREYLSGLAEVVKYGVIWDAVFFAELEREAERLLRRDPECLEKIVARCCEIKADVVAVDEREGGLRAILNFGHTLAHALELADGYGRWLHGEAVAIGMHFAALLSVLHQGLPATEAARIVALLRRLGLPAGPAAGTHTDWAQVRAAMGTDKKSVAGQVRLVLAHKLGAAVTGCAIPEESLAEAWHVCCQ